MLRPPGRHAGLEELRAPKEAPHPDHAAPSDSGAGQTMPKPVAQPLRATAGALYNLRPRIIRLDAAWGLTLLAWIHRTLGRRRLALARLWPEFLRFQQGRRSPGCTEVRRLLLAGGRPRGLDCLHAARCEHCRMFSVYVGSQ